MPVDSQHSEYKKNIYKWQRCRDCVDGSDAVKHRSTTYLPKLDGQKTTQYDAYLQRALFYGASGRTVQGLLGALFRIDPTVKYPQDDHLLAFTSTGVPLVDFSRTTAEEILIVGRCGVLVDMPQEGSSRAFAARYAAERVVNWQTALVDGQEKLIRVVLQETYTIPEDAFSFEEDTQYRVLQIVESKYEVDVYRKIDKSESDWAIVPELHAEPKIRGKRMDFIPFQFFNSNSLTPEVVKPPLLDLVDVNLSHFRTSADLEHGAHFTALPTAVLSGFEAGQTYSIGSGKAWVSSNKDAKATFLEYTGQGLGALVDLSKSKEDRMAVLGARMLEQQKAAAEAADTKRLHASGEQSALTTIATTVSDGMVQVMLWMAEWSGSGGEAEFEMNKDFVASRMDPRDMAELTKAFQQNAISQDTYLWNLKRGEILAPDRTIEDEKKDIQVAADMSENEFSPEGPTTPVDLVPNTNS